MKVSLKWLKRYVSIEATPQELSEVFPMLGFEVEEVIIKGLPFVENVVVGEVKSRIQHPNADKLGVCEVQVGPNLNDVKQIVCGATNFKVGDRVPVALVGAVLPGDVKIKKSKLRGVESEGMMCSPAELRLSNDQDGLLIFEGEPELGTPINQVLKGDDVIFDLALTANRGDCLSHIGLARELASYYNIELKLPKIPSYEYTEGIVSNDHFNGVDVKSLNCPLYSAWVIKGVKVESSPEWLKKDLEALGLRSVNNIVDITNWLMMDCGQPLHAFDLAKIKGQKLIVREAQAGEEITTLDGKKRVLEERMTVIADKDRSLVIAGIMGSLEAEVDNNTVDIVLESAYFEPTSIRHTMQKLHLSTDSSYRFVRDVDPKGVINTAQRAIEMILKIAGGQFISPGIVIGKEPRGDCEIEMVPDFVRKQCGFEVPDEVIKDVYQRLGFAINSKGSVWKVTVPSFRADVKRPIDLVEEFLRVYGTNKIPKAPVRMEGLSRKDDPIAIFNHKVIDYLVGQHFNECYHYSLRQGEEIIRLYGGKIAQYCALDNPLTADHTHFRVSLLPGLFDALRLNQRNGNNVQGLFETGRVIQVVHEKPYEVLSVGFVIAIEDPYERNWLKREAADFYKAKNLILEIANIAGIELDDNIAFESINDSSIWENNRSARIGILDIHQYRMNVGLVDLKLTKDWGIHGPILAGEILLMPEILNKSQSEVRFKYFSTFPSSRKDLALVMNAAFPAKTARRALYEVAKRSVEGKFNVESVEIFDVYQGKGLEEGKKSIAFSIIFRADDRTLKDEEIMNAFDKIQADIVSDGHFAIRS